MAEIRAKYHAHVAAHAEDRRRRRRRREGQAHRRARDQDRARPRDERPRPRTCTTATTTGRKPSSPRRRRASTGTRSSAAGLPAQADFVVWQPKAVAGIAALVKSEPLATWKEYLAFHAIESASPVLPKAFVDENFAFFGTTLFGVPEQRDRWKRALEQTTAALGEAVGKLYVAKYFPPAEKAQAQAMVAERARRVREADRQARLDGAGDEGEGEGQARRAEGRRRLPRHVARLLRARGRRGRRLRQLRARVAVRVRIASSRGSASRSIAASG